MVVTFRGRKWEEAYGGTPPVTIVPISSCKGGVDLIKVTKLKKKKKLTILG